ncbi:MAG: Coenzyme F420 hydrogenase/dehydrogenase, beta subunit C-terminal domain [Archaeoglobaceae archaeon]
MELIVDEDLCTGCGNCAIVCPVNFPMHYNDKKEIKIEGGKIRVIGGLCNGCGLCVESCPFKALSLNIMESEELEWSQNIFESVESAETVVKETKLDLNPRLNEIYDNTVRPFSTGLLRWIFEGEDVNIDQIRNFILDYDEKGNVFEILSDLIIQKDLCSLCGACVAVCDENAIEIIDYTPQLVGECVNCASCYFICPKTRIFKEYKSMKPMEEERILSIRSLKKSILTATTHGGGTSTLLIYALEKGIIDCAIVMKDNTPALATKPQDIIEAAGIKFGISPNVSMLHEAVDKGYKKIALVGVPCNVTAARTIQSIGLEELKLIIGVFCPRGTHPEMDTPLACQFCTDLTADLSDISIGSIGSSRGWRTVIVRTEIGEELLQDATREGYIQTTEVSAEGIGKIEKMSRKKKVKGEEKMEASQEASQEASHKKSKVESG